MLKQHRQKQSFPAEISSIEDILNYSEKCLMSRKINENLLKEYRLVLEEVALKLIENASRASEVTVESFRRLDEVFLRLSCAGEPIVLEQESAEDFGGKILEEYQDYLNQSYSSGINSVDFSYSGGYIKKWNLFAILGAVVGAILIRLFCREDQIQLLNDQIFYPLNRFYAGCMQTIAAPVVFLSLMTLIVKLKHKFDHNRQLGLMFVNYIVTSLIAIVIGFLSQKFYPLNSVTPSLSFLRESSSAVAYNSPKEFIEMFTFANILEPFQISNPVPMLFIAVLAGIAVSRVQGNEGKWSRNAVISLNSIFAKMLALVYDMIPVFLLISILPNLVTDGFRFVEEVLLLVLLFVIAVAFLFVVYSFRLSACGISPVRFLREYGGILKENFRIGSNIQALPYNKRMIGRKTNISAFSLNEQLSLGAMVNMDGNCLIITAFSFYMLFACGVEATPALVVNYIFTLIMLSIGAPNQPGSFLVGMIFIMSMVGISSDMYDLVIIVEALFGTLYSFVNSVGDIVSVVCADSLNARKQSTAPKA